MSQRPLEPVKPSSMELVFFYTCPHCHRELPTFAQIQPTLLMCETCGQHFPIVPVDEYTVQFIKVVLDNGPAAIDPDFL